MYALGRAQNQAAIDTPNHTRNSKEIAGMTVPNLLVEMAPLGRAQTVIDTDRGTTGQLARAITVMIALPGDTMICTTGLTIINTSNTTMPIAAGIITPATHHRLTPIYRLTPIAATTAPRPWEVLPPFNP